jgi:large subunit ribosomal protein L25
MANQQITAQVRTVLGKKVKRLRREGLLPGVLYGPAVKGVRPITVTARDFERVYVRAGFSTLLDLVVDGGRAQPVLIHQVQHDALRRDLLHVDFLAPDMNVELTVTVPLVLVGEAPVVEAGGGILTQVVTELQVRCLPDAIPHQIEVDVSGLTEPDSHILAGDLQLPPGVTLVAPPDELLVKIDQPQLEPEPEVEEEEAEAPAGEVEAEGGEAEQEAAEPAE